MQCASSTTSSPVSASSGSARSANLGLASRSGETSRTSTSSAASASKTCCQSSTLAELTVAARSPARAGGGDLVAHQREQRRDHQRRPAAGLPQRARSPPSRPPTCPSRSPARAAPGARSTSASTASTWSGRGRAAGPGHRRQHPVERRPRHAVHARHPSRSPACPPHSASQLRQENATTQSQRSRSSSGDVDQHLADGAVLDRRMRAPAAAEREAVQRQARRPARPGPRRPPPRR